MIRSIAKFALFAALTAGVFTTQLPVAHAGDNILKDFAGEWRGTGAVRTGSDSKKEKLVCRIDGQLDDSGDALVLSGRCGGERFTGTFKIAVTYSSKGPHYKAIYRDSLGSKSPPLTGLISGDRLVFRIRHNDFETKGRAISTLIVDPKASKFRIVGRTKPAEAKNDFLSADLIFVRG